MSLGWLITACALSQIDGGAGAARAEPPPPVAAERAAPAPVAAEPRYRVVLEQPAPPASSAPLLVELGKALAWPIVVLAALVLFRRELLRLVRQLGPKVRSVEAFGFKLALAEPIGGPAEGIFSSLRTEAQVVLEDSGRELLTSLLQDPAPARYALINIETGHAWLTSRLHITGVLLEQARRLEAFVFVDGAEAVEQRFVAVAPVRTVVALLGAQYPWLDGALAAATLAVGVDHTNFEVSFPARPMVSDAAGVFRPGPIPDNIEGKVLAWNPPQLLSTAGRLQAMLTKYLALLQDPASSLIPIPLDAWASFDTPSGRVREAAAWLDKAAVLRLAGPGWNDAWMTLNPDEPRDAQARRVLRCPGDFVALVDREHRFTGLVDRRAMLEELAAARASEGDRTTDVGPERP